MTDKDVVPNILINEKSPYLLQHAHNPVNWYPWGEEAFSKAKAEDKPIFLSIGYSTCHWCHVMERECFEDEDVAKVLNENFISIKVDREERSDIDSIYMTFCQAYTGSGGWPLTIIMTPEKKPFFAGTYFPKESKYGRPGLIELLDSIYDMWSKDKKRLINYSLEMIDQIKRETEIEIDENNKINESVIKETIESLKQFFDKRYGGFSRVPKFPTPHNMYFLLEYYIKTEDKKALNMVEETLKHMYKGGIFDHVGFGFSRYSTDEKWLVPHFEKMLYDNALLSLIYTKTYEITGKELYKRIAEKIYTYMINNMISPEGGFYSAEDADSEGIEGKFYVWDIEEIEKVLGKQDGKTYCELYGITERGNFEEKNIPNLINRDIEKLELNENLKEQLEKMRAKLYDYREKRIHPFKDDKTLTSWNGLAIASFAYGGRIFNNQSYIEISERAADFILKRLIRDDGRLLSRYREGESAYAAVLEDYAFVIWGLIELYKANSQYKYQEKCIYLHDQMMKLFWDEKQGGLYLYGLDSEELIVRPKELYDGAIPSGNSVATFNMLRLYDITDDTKFKQFAERQFKAFGTTAKRNPIAYTHFITAYINSFNLFEKI
ncbi:thioredoxin domain-containing protein [Clostridium aciditolerans]|uniref:Thioredoxin domain-containing protein n=1 Tax=Clostridium aciditolerans TaxID=339861 RepID=A0A934M4Z2_9CLOT|nr:thioredoxin domain-containing protein [Clostridium aciditolerans]MBI6871471.1 thioredoxin domain-containing protein [Clostridium aciditolerans]